MLELLEESVYPLPYPSPRDTFDVRRQKPAKIQGFCHTLQKTMAPGGVSLDAVCRSGRMYRGFYAYVFMHMYGQGQNYV